MAASVSDTVLTGRRPMARSGTPSRSKSTNQSSEAVSSMAVSTIQVGTKSDGPKAE